MNQERNIVPKISVKETFKKPGQIEVVAVAGISDGFQVLSMFDHPETLVAREMPDGVGFLVIKRSDIPAIELRQQIANEVMQERGYNPSNVEDIPMNAILEMRTEIRKRLDKELEDRK